MRVSEDSWRVRKAQTRLAVQLDDYQAEHGLSDIEMLQALNLWQATVLKFMLRAERGDVDRPADAERPDTAICGDAPAPCNCDDPTTHNGH